jgi:hypothetical protein
MAVFNFMETTFVISLGITFVLVLLLIYHFKQRLSIAENKQDTMFEIINNLAQELNNIKISLSNAVMSPAPYPFSNVQNEEQNLSEIDLQASELNDFSLIHKQEDEIDSEEESSEDDDSDISDDSDDEEEKIIVSEDEDNISVEDVTDKEVEQQEQIENIPHEKKEEEQELEASVPNFSKMNLGALKSYIIEKGLVEDASKMKKAQILALIEQQH